jgi:two-component sensor histidine kinase
MHIMTTIPSQLPFPQAQLLLHELNHRIGNEFCCAVSVVSLAAARSSDKEVKAVLTEVAELLHPYAEVHHALQMPEHGIRTDVAAYLRKLFTEDSKRAAGLVGLQSPRAAEIGCDQVEGRAVRAD